MRDFKISKNVKNDFRILLILRG